MGQNIEIPWSATLAFTLIFREMLDLFSELRRIKDICHIKPPEVPQSDHLTVEDSGLLPQPP